MKFSFKNKFSSFRIIALEFSAVILFGALLLFLPISSADGKLTPFPDALFTSVSAVCVTGLVVADTATHWSVFGQIVILLLIQIGGIGVVSVAAAFAIIAGKKIGIFERGTMKDAISAPSVGGIVGLVGFILKGIFAIELAGAVALMPVFVRDFGARGIWMSIFHSISAFCNAGFDIMGADSGQFSSLTAYSADPVINIVIPLLIIVGGIGFLTWEDVIKHKWHFSKYRMQTKVILTTTALLILVPAIYYFFFAFKGEPFPNRVAMSFFQSVTTRTAGFNTVDESSLGEVGIGLTTVLMLVGGAPGSTAGGMKVTTIVVLFASAISVFGNKEEVGLFRRRVEADVVRQASAVFISYVTLFLLGGAIISLAEGLPLYACLFETASAIGTVGLSLGLTPSLGIVSKIILMALMFFGRVGGLTIIYAAVGKKIKSKNSYPSENVAVG